MTKRGHAALAIGLIGSKSETGAKHVRKDLIDAGQAERGVLLKVQTSAEAAFAAVRRGARDCSVVTEAILQVALRKLNVDAANTGAAFNESGREASDAFLQGFCRLAASHACNPQRSP